MTLRPAPRVALVALSLVGVALAGCAMPEPPPCADCGDVCDDCGTPSCEDCGALCDDCGEPPVPMVEANATSQPPDDAWMRVPVAHPFAVDGRTEGAVCVATPVAGSCEIYGEHENGITELEGSPVSRLAGNVTWEASSPATAELAAFVMAWNGEAWGWLANYTVTGSSPLAFDWDLTALDAERLALGVYHEAAHDAGAVYAAVELEQVFRAEGVFFAPPRH